LTDKEIIIIKQIMALNILLPMKTVSKKVLSMN